MDSDKGGKIISKFERATIAALEVLVMLLIAAATIVLFVLFVHGLYTQSGHIESVETLIPVMQKAFAGLLIVVLGLELLEALKTYFTTHTIRMEVVLSVAITAVGRHVLQIDFEHMDGSSLVGLAAVILALCVGYYLVKTKNAPVIQAGANLDGQH
jgi:uncharacterized membrane protein (DUF373 family)